MGEDMKKISLEYQWAIGKKTGVGWYIYNIVKAKGMITNEKNIIIISSSPRRNGNSQLLCNQFMQGGH